MLNTLAAYVSCGSMIGIISGLFGIGGGIVGIPVMLTCFAVEGMPKSLAMHMAVGTMMAVAAATTVAAVSSHHKNNMILVPLFKKIAPFLVVGSLIGTIISSHTNSIYLERAFAVFLLAVAVRIVWQVKPKANSALPHNAIVAITSILIGIVSAFFGLGGGLLLVPFLNWSGIPLKNAIATATACIVPATAFGALSYMLMNANAASPVSFSTGYIYWPAFLGISVMSMSFAPLGAYLTRKTAAPVLRAAFAVLLIFVALHLLK